MKLSRAQLLLFGFFAGPCLAMSHGGYAPLAADEESTGFGRAVWRYIESPNHLKTAIERCDGTDGFHVWMRTHISVDGGMPVWGPLNGRFVAFSPNGGIVAISTLKRKFLRDVNQVTLYSSETGTRLFGPKDGWLREFGPDGRTVIVEDVDEYGSVWGAKLYSIAMGKVIRNIRFGDEDCCLGRSDLLWNFSPDGHVVALATNVSGSGVWYVMLYSAVTGKPLLGPLRGRSVRFERDSQSMSVDGAVYAIDNLDR